MTLNWPPAPPAYLTGLGNGGPNAHRHRIVLPLPDGTESQPDHRDASDPQDVPELPDLPLTSKARAPA